MSTKRPDIHRSRLLFVLQYFYPDVTGFSQLMGDLATYLSDSGRYECTVLAGSTVRSTEAYKRLPIRMGAVRIRRIRTPRVGKRTLLHRLLEYSTFYTGVAFFLLLHHDYDAVICLTTPPLIGLAAAAGLSFFRTPLIYYVQDLYPELLYDMGYVKNPWLIRRFSGLSHLIFRRADRVVTIGRWMAKRIHRNYGMPLSSLPVVENWATGIEYSPPRQHGPFVILYTGNVGLAHDFSLLPGLLRRLSENDAPEVTVRFVGSGRQYQSVERLCARQQAGIALEFSGYVQREDLDGALAGGNMFLVAQSERSVGDILPSKFYGYLSAGRPILYLGTRKSEIGEAIEDYDLGVVVECKDDFERAAELIKNYARNRTDYVDACERVSAYYRERLGFERSARRFESVVAEAART